MKKQPLSIMGFFDDGADLREPWEVKTRRRRRRIHKMTLARAVAKARKAGVTSGTVTVDGVSLSFGEPHAATKPNGHAIEDADELRDLI